MRPSRLTIQAFGPYSNRQVIDFRDAVEAGLFGIYGPTGAGKSTIFSAMTFALFGEAAKSEQDVQSLRCDLAHPSLATEVEFVFDIGERRFVILRRPDQLRPKVRGGGYTTTKHEAFFFDATGMTLDEINEENLGKIIKEKKVREVDLALQNLLGYGPEQFRQIVLLPQGQFEKFLAAKTKERLNILRDLFDVSIYRQLAEKLKSDAEKSEHYIRNVRDVCAQRLSAEGFESVDALNKGISESKKTLSEHEDRVNLAHKEFSNAQKAFQDAQTLEDKFKSCEDAKQVLARLRERKKSMDALATQVKKAEKAQLLLDLESAVRRAISTVTEAKQSLEGAQQEDANARKNLASADKIFRQEQERSTEIDDMSRRLDNLKRCKEKLVRAKQLQEKVEIATTAEEEVSEKLNLTKTQLKECRNKKSEKETLLKSARTIATLSNALSAAETYERALSAKTTSKKHLETLTSTLSLVINAEHKAQEQFRKAEKNLSKAQALHLASKLSEGDPCPVCGATNHPSPATGSAEQAGLDKAFREARANLEDATSNVREADRAVESKKSELDVHTEMLANLSKPEEPAANIHAKIEAEKSAMGGPNLTTDVQTVESEIDQLASQIITFETEQDNLSRDLAEKQKSTTSISATLEELLTGVPRELREPETLLAKTDDTARSLAERKKTREGAEKAAAKAKESAIVAKKELETARKNLSDCNKRQRQAEGELSSRLQKVGLTGEEFVRLKPAIDNITTDRKTIEEFAINLKSAEDSANTKAQEIRELIRPNLEETRAKQDEALNNLNNATDERAAAKQTLSHRAGVRDELARTLLKIEEEEKTSGPLRSIASLTNGENLHKVDLETFAIGAMFDQVLKAANLRLGPMTTNRYQLERDIESEGRGKRGLGIQVFDFHSGKTRPTVTLSGGETFIAALALALGLADIVESVSGKVRLDTIFIDEGFGSLDTENGAGTLDQVLNVLNSLVTQSRSVGLISHVPLVQEAVPNGFYVRKNLAQTIIESRGQI